MQNEYNIRLHWADLLRVISIYGVILIHSSGAFFYQYGEIDEGTWLTVNFLDSLVRCSVPLFVMLSGAVLLHRNVIPCNVIEVFFRVRKVLVPLLFWSAFYFLYLYLVGAGAIDYLSFFSRPAMYHLWFVYMIIGVYITLPFLQVLFNLFADNPTLKFYFFALWFLVTCVPIYCHLPVLGLLQFTSLLGYGGYFLLGAVLAHLPGRRLSSTFWGVIFLTGVLLTFLLTWLFSSQAGVASERAYVYFSPNVLLSAIAAFILAKRIKVSRGFSECFRWIADRSFVIFFVHIVVLEFVRYSALIDRFSENNPVAAVVIVISLITFVISLVISAVLKALPIIRRVVG